jgi:hypothetical protein
LPYAAREFIVGVIAGTSRGIGSMGLIILLIILIFLFGGGGFYYGPPYHPLIRSCLAKKLSQMPDVKVATASIEGARFVVDIVAAKNTNKKMSASLVVAEIFPMEQFQPRMKEGENAEALLTSIQYYTLLRMHEVIPARSDEALCLSIAADIGDQVLSKEYTERND